MSPTFLSFTISLKVKRTLNFFSILFISCMLVSESHPSTSWAVVSLSSTMFSLFSTSRKMRLISFKIVCVSLVKFKLVLVFSFCLFCYWCSAETVPGNAYAWESCSREACYTDIPLSAVCRAVSSLRRDAVRTGCRCRIWE